MEENNIKAGNLQEEILMNMTLMERLRQQLVLVNPTTEEEARQKMKLIIEHRSKFPSKLRAAISEAASDGDGSSEVQPEVFLSEVYSAAKDFFLGQPTDRNQEEIDETWHGLDSEVDTEEEVEVALRFFPNILTETKQVSPLSSLNGCYPIFMLLVYSKAIFFVPLFAELGIELGQFKRKDRGGLTCFMRNIFFHLICNKIAREELDEESSRKRDATSTAIMVRLKEKGLMKKEDIYDHNLVNLLLYRALNNETFRIERRLKFLIDWNPSILVECGRGNNLLYHYVNRLCIIDEGHLPLYHHLNHLCIVDEGHVPPNTVKGFQVIFELGMSHFVTDLGFLFHKNTFRVACEKFGAKQVTQIVDGEILNTLRRENNSLQALVFAAATNDEISLDGIYTLVRRDPIALLSQSSTTTQILRPRDV